MLWMDYKVYFLKPLPFYFTMKCQIAFIFTHAILLWLLYACQSQYSCIALKSVQYFQIWIYCGIVYLSNVLTKLKVEYSLFIRCMTSHLHSIWNLGTWHHVKRPKRHDHNRLFSIFYFVNLKLCQTLIKNESLLSYLP